MWSNRLHDAGYLVGYYGKWHVERSYGMEHFGFARNCAYQEPETDYYEHRRRLGPSDTPVESTLVIDDLVQSHDVAETLAVLAGAGKGLGGHALPGGRPAGIGGPRPDSSYASLNAAASPRFI